MSKESPDSDLVKLVKELESLKQDIVDAESVIEDANLRYEEAFQVWKAANDLHIHVRQQAANAIELTNVELRQVRAMLTQHLGLARVDDCCRQVEPSMPSRSFPGNLH